jgi:hypothetical protein
LAIRKNILNGADTVHAQQFAVYALAVEGDLAGADDATVLGAAFKFPSPLREDVAR